MALSEKFKDGVRDGRKSATPRGAWEKKDIVNRIPY
jgi:hypothetical protein